MQGDLTLDRQLTLGCLLAVLRTGSNEAAAALQLRAAKVEGGIYDPIIGEKSGEISDERQQKRNLTDALTERRIAWPCILRRLDELV